MIQGECVDMGGLDGRGLRGFMHFVLLPNSQPPPPSQVESGAEEFSGAHGQGKRAGGLQGPGMGRSLGLSW